MLTIPIKTVPGLNAREPWQVRTGRVKRERKATAWLLKTITRPALPCSVILTRLSAGHMDDDNLPGALKSVRDEIAKWLGVDDRDRLTVRYVYRQRQVPRGQFGVEVEFGPAVSGAQMRLGVEVEAA